MKRPRTKKTAKSRETRHEETIQPQMADVDEASAKPVAANGDEADYVDFSQLLGVGEGSDDSDDDEALRFIDVSKLPAQVLSETISDEAALGKKLGDIALFNTVPANNVGKLEFRESLLVTMQSDGALNAKLAADDLARERRFAELATEAVHEGLRQLREMKVKFRRPDDYFAQMIKTDEQMTRVKTHLLKERENILAAQKRRNNRDINKNKKKVRQEQRLQAQQKQKDAKDEIKAVSQLRKDRVRKRAEVDTAPADDDDEFPIDLLNVEQLDSESRFTSITDIESGKKKAWAAPKKNDPQSGKKVGPGGIKKKRGPKKRLGKNRRQKVASKLM